MPETGCIIDGHYGQYIYGMIVDLARDYGYNPSDCYVAECKRQMDDLTKQQAQVWMTPEATEEVVEESELAVQYLNEKVAAKDHYFEWSDGEFFYMADSWWDDDETESEEA